MPASPLTPYHHRGRRRAPRALSTSLPEPASIRLLLRSASAPAIAAAWPPRRWTTAACASSPTARASPITTRTASRCLRRPSSTTPTRSRSSRPAATPSAPRATRSYTSSSSTLIESIFSPGPSFPLAPSYQTQPYPGQVPPSMADNPTPLTGKVVNLFSSAGQTTSFTVVLKNFGNCPTLAQFFPYGYWWAAFGDTYKTDACCGQMNMGPLMPGMSVP
eukprot:365739-Chlamydomonas_euryale.AAC.3